MSDREKITVLQTKLKQKTLKQTKTQTALTKANKQIEAFKARSTHQRQANNKKRNTNKQLQQDTKQLLQENTTFKYDINTISNQLNEILSNHGKCNRKEMNSLKGLLKTINEYSTGIFEAKFGDNREPICSFNMRQVLIHRLFET